MSWRTKKGDGAHLDEGQDGHDELDGVTEGRVQQTAERLAETQRCFLGREPKQPS